MRRRSLPPVRTALPVLVVVSAVLLPGVASAAGPARTTPPAAASAPAALATLRAEVPAPGVLRRSPAPDTTTAPSATPRSTPPLSPTGSAGALTPLAAPGVTVVPGTARPPLSTWQVTYSGFTPQAQAAFQAAVDIWAGWLRSPVPITVSATMSDLGDPDLLGQTRPGQDYAGRGLGDGTSFYPKALANALVGVDIDASTPDVISVFNSGAAATYYGTDGAPAAGQTDFETVVLHELGHGLGFIGSMSVSGGAGSYQVPPDAFDTFTRGPGGTRLLALPNGSSALAARLQSGGVTWGGANGIAKGQGVAPRLYAPAEWEPGSSYAHLDEDAYPRGDVNSLMTPYLADQEVVRDPGPMTIGILQDLGYRLGADPTGSLDTVATAPGGILASGWALTPDRTTTLAVHVYLGGRGTVTTAAGPRPDLGAAFPAAGTAHGWSVSASTAGLPEGPSTLCAYAISVTGGPNTTLGCRTVSVRHTPLGGLDSISVGPTTTTVSGWALDPDTAASIGAHVYVGGRGFPSTATGTRSDIAAAFPGFGAAHGYAVAVTGNRDLPAGASTFCAYGIDSSGGPSATVGCRTVQVGHDPRGSLDAAVATPQGIRVTGWAVDPDTADSTTVHVYDGATGHPVTASGPRSDIAAAFPGYGSAHGYDVTLPGGPGRHDLCAYAINVYSGATTSLGCRTVVL